MVTRPDHVTTERERQVTAAVLTVSVSLWTLSRQKYFTLYVMFYAILTSGPMAEHRTQ